MAQFFDQAISRPLLIFVPEWIHPNDLTVARATCLLPLIEARSYPTLAVSIVILSRGLRSSGRAAGACSRACVAIRGRPRRYC